MPLFVVELLLLFALCAFEEPTVPPDPELVPPEVVVVREFVVEVVFPVARTLAGAA